VVHQHHIGVLTEFKFMYLFIKSNNKYSTRTETHFVQSFFIYQLMHSLKNNFKIHIKINIKTAPTCFGAVTPSSGSTLFVLAKVSC